MASIHWMLSLGPPAFGQIFKNPNQIAKKLSINLNLRPQNLSPDMYYKITREYEKLRS